MEDRKTIISLFATLIEDECLGRVDCGGCPFEKAEMCGSLDGVEIANELRNCVDEDGEDEEIPEPDDEIGFNPYSGHYDYDC